MDTIAVDQPLTYEEERGKPMPSLNHGIIQINLAVEFAKHSEYRVVSELTLDLGAKPDATPDLSVFPRVPANFLQDQVRSKTVPAMIVEILSPTQGSFEVLQRFQRYFEAGVKSCWLIDPPLRTILIMQSGGTETLVHSGTATDPATGLTAEWSKVFV